MKRQILSAALSVGIISAIAQSDKIADSKISRVTVFLTSAQVTREATARVDAGKTNIILTGLTSQLDPESIQVSGKGSVMILGISHRQNFLSEFNMPKALRSLRDSIEYLQRQVSFEQSQKEILTKEEQMLMSNQKIGGTNQNLTVAELKAMADFYRSRLTEIVSSKMKEDEKIKKFSERITRLQQQINSQNELFARNTSEIVISVSAEAATSVALEVNYIVANAGWYPVYDIRAIDTKRPMQLSYKANVHQATGEEWHNVRLKLSTANPNLGGLKPELWAWYLNFNQPLYEVQSYDKRKSMAPAMAGAGEDKAVAKEEVASLSEVVTTIQTTLNTEFDIALPYSVLSSSKPTVVDVKNYDLKANFHYAVAPKLDPDAFLIAEATGWEEFNLLPGEANIFFEGTFVGKTAINPANVKDTLSLSLGRDKRIVVKREKLKELTSRKLIGTNQRESYAWEISVRNTKSESVRVTVEDQVPVSQNSQIEVGAIETGSAAYNKDTGKLTWDLQLQPSETKKVTFRYEVKYPKDKQVNGL